MRDPQPLMPAPAPAPAPPPPPLPPAPPPPPALPPEKVIDKVRHHLDLGQEAEALVELNQLLEAQPGYAPASHYLKQLQDDPVKRLGAASQPYRVEPGDKMSGLAARFLGDPTLFYLLARYSGVKVPGQLQAGQMIRVPTRRVVLSTAAPTAPPPPAPPVTSPTSPTPAPPPPPPPPPAPPVDDLLRRARVEMAKQNPCGAIRHLNLALAQDANHVEARSEHRKASALLAEFNRRKGLPPDRC